MKQRPVVDERSTLANQSEHLRIHNLRVRLRCRLSSFLRLLRRRLVEIECKLTDRESEMKRQHVGAEYGKIDTATKQI